MGQALYFKSENEAESALKQAGFSIGTSQRDDPRGVMFGDMDISKWRNLTSEHRAELHGIYQRARRDGPVEIVLSRNCPEQGKTKLTELALTE